MRIKTVIATLMSILFAQISFSTPAQAETYYSYSFEDDPDHFIQVLVPQGWIVVEEKGDNLYDLKLVDRLKTRQCLLFVGKSERSLVTSHELKESGEELMEYFFKDKSISNDKISFSSSAYVRNFELLEGGSTVYAAVVVYPMNNFLVGQIMENRKSKNDLVTDCNDISSNISLMRNP